MNRDQAQQAFDKAELIYNPLQIEQAVDRMAEAITNGNRFDPDFDHARELHELLEALQHSSDAGRAVKSDGSNQTH